MAFTGPNGMSPSHHIRLLASAAGITSSDAQEAGQVLRSRIRARCTQGIDVNGMPMKPLTDKYAQRKMAALGTAMPDLFGISQGLHMLNAITVGGDNIMMSGGDEMAALFGIEFENNVSFEGGDTSPATAVSLVIRDERAATLARAHNEGATITTRLGKGKGKPKKGGVASFVMPQRRFFDANEDDLQLMALAIGNRQERRLKAAG